MARKVGRMRQVFGDYCSDLPDQIWTGGAGLFSIASKKSRPIEKTGPLDSASNLSVGFEKIKHALRRTYADVVENHTMQMAAAVGPEGLHMSERPKSRTYPGKWSRIRVLRKGSCLVAQRHGAFLAG